MSIKNFLDDIRKSIRGKSEQLIGEENLKGFLKRLLKALDRTIEALEKGIEGASIKRFKKAVVENPASKKLASLGRYMKEKASGLYNQVFSDEDIKDDEAGKRPYDEAQGPPSDEPVDEKTQNTKRKGLGITERVMDNIKDTSEQKDRFYKMLRSAKEKFSRGKDRVKDALGMKKETPFGFMKMLRIATGWITGPIVGVIKWATESFMSFLPRALGSVLGGTITTTLKNVLGGGILGKGRDLLAKSTQWLAGKTGKNALMTGARTLWNVGKFVVTRGALTLAPVAAPVAAAAAIGTAAYYGFKYITRNDLKDGHYKYYDLLRLYMYGFNESDEENFHKVFTIEEAIKPNIKIIMTKNGAPKAVFRKLSKDQMEDMLDVFDISLDDPADETARQIFSDWIQTRVIPVYGEFLIATRLGHPSADIDNIEDKIKDPKRMLKVITKIPVSARYFKAPYIPLRRPDGGMQESKVTLEDAKNLKARYTSLLKDMVMGKVDKDIGTGLFGSEKELDEALKRTNVEENEKLQIIKNKVIKAPVKRKQPVRRVMDIHDDFRRRDYDREQGAYTKMMQELISRDTDDRIDAMKIGYREMETYFRTDSRNSYKRFFLTLLMYYSTGYKVNDAKAITGFLGVRYLMSEAIKRVRPAALNLLSEVKLTEDEMKFAKEAMSWLTDSDQGLEDFLYKRLLPVMFHVTYLARNNTNEMTHSWDFNMFFERANYKSLLEVVEDIKFGPLVLEATIDEEKPQPYVEANQFILEEYRKNLILLLEALKARAPVTRDFSAVKAMNDDIVLEIEKVKKATPTAKTIESKPKSVIKNDHVVTVTDKKKAITVKPKTETQAESKSKTEEVTEFFANSGIRITDSPSLKRTRYELGAYREILENLKQDEKYRDNRALVLGDRLVKYALSTRARTAYKKHIQLLFAYAMTGKKLTNAYYLAGLLGATKLVFDKVAAANAVSADDIDNLNFEEKEINDITRVLDWWFDDSQAAINFLHMRILPFCVMLHVLIKKHVANYGTLKDKYEFYEGSTYKEIIDVLKDLDAFSVLNKIPVKESKPIPYPDMDNTYWNEYKQKIIDFVIYAAKNKEINTNDEKLLALDTDLNVRAYDIYKSEEKLTGVSAEKRMQALQQASERAEQAIQPKSEPKPEPGQLTKQALKAASLDPKHAVTDDTEDAPQGDSNVASRPADNAKALNTPMAVPSGALEGVVFKSDYSKVRYPLMDSKMRHNFEAMAKEYYETTGKTIQVNETARTYEDQMKLYKQRQM